MISQPSEDLFLDLFFKLNMPYPTMKVDEIIHSWRIVEIELLQLQLLDKYTLWDTMHQYLVELYYFSNVLIEIFPE